MKDIKYLERKVSVFIILSISVLLMASSAFALSSGSRLDEVIARFERMKTEIAMEIRKCEETIARSQKIVTLALRKGNAKAESIARQALSKAHEAKRKNEATRSEIERSLAMLQRMKGKEGEIDEATVRIAKLRDDVKEIQFALQLYRDALLTNVSSLDREGNNISEMSDRILVDGIDYLKGGAFSRLLKTNFKYWNKEKYEKYEKIIGHVEQLQTEKDILSWINSGSDDMEKLIEGTDLLASTVVPGWCHIKVNFKAWSTVAKECSSWRKINTLKRETDEYSTAIKNISERMKIKVGEINCLKQCMDEYIVGCVDRCGG